jgi:N-methylhydantoinase A
LADLQAADVEAVAICLLWSTENPDHELEISTLVTDQLPHAFVSVSHIVAPSVGEYSRASTTAANAALGRGALLGGSRGPARGLRDWR